MGERERRRNRKKERVREDSECVHLINRAKTRKKGEEEKLDLEKIRRERKGKRREKERQK